MVNAPSFGTPWLDGIFYGTVILACGLLLYVFPDSPRWFCGPGAVVFGGSLLGAGILKGRAMNWKLNKTR